MGEYATNALVVSGRSTGFGVTPSDANYRIISSGSTLFSGGTMIVKGSGTTSSSTAFVVQNSSGGTLLNLFNNGNLNIDNGALYVNGDTGDVGIGTSNPLNKLHISGSPGDIVYIVANTGQSAVIGATGSGTNRMYIGYSPGTENISITSGNVVRLNPSGSGNVLIGTTTDAGYKLDVNGTGVFRGNLEVNTGAANGGLFINNPYPRILFGKTGTPNWSMNADTENSGQFEIGTGAGFPYNNFLRYIYLGITGQGGIGLFGIPNGNTKFLVSGSTNAQSNLAQGVSMSNTLVGIVIVIFNYWFVKHL
jgi:hypothetical protein